MWNLTLKVFLLIFFPFLDAYKDNFVALTDGEKVRGKVVRPNIECIDGYIHVTDTVMLDDSPPWTAIAGASKIPRNSPMMIFSAIILMTCNLFNFF